MLLTEDGFGEVEVEGAVDVDGVAVELGDAAAVAAEEGVA